MRAVSRVRFGCAVCKVIETWPGGGRGRPQVVTACGAVSAVMWQPVPAPEGQEADDATVTCIYCITSELYERYP